MTPNSIYEKDEIPWNPEHALFSYIACNYNRVQAVIELPQYFNGEDYKAGVTDDGNWLYFKMPVGEVFLNHGHLQSYLTQCSDREFSNDSSLTNCWESSEKAMKGKWKTLRTQLPFSCQKEFATDVGSSGGIDHANITYAAKDGTARQVTILVIELKSKAMINETQVEDQKKLVRKNFTSPAAKVSKPCWEEVLAHIGKFDTVEEARKYVISWGYDPDTMQVDILYAGMTNKKRKTT